MKKTLLLLILIVFHFGNGYTQTCIYTNTSWLVNNIPGTPPSANWKTSNNSDFVFANVSSLGGSTLDTQVAYHDVSGRHPGIDRSKLIWRNSFGFRKNLFFKKIIHNSCAGTDSITSITLRLSADDQVDNVWFNGVSVLGTPITGWRSIGIITIPSGMIKRGDNYICIEASDLSNVASWLYAEVCIAPHSFECCIQPCFSLPDTICEGSPIIPDLGCMQEDVESYRWVIMEEGSPSWIIDTVLAYQSGPVTPMDMNTVWHFDPCKRYYVSIDVFKKCSDVVVNASTNRSFYYAPKPEAMVSDPPMLSCAESCVTLNASQFGLASCETPASFQWKDGSGSYIGHPITICPFTFPYTYTLELRNNFGCTSQYPVTVTKDTCCMNLCFTLADTICEGSSVVPNLGCMQQNVTWYRWVIAEETGSGWSTVYTGSYLSGPVVPANMFLLWTFQPCIRYKVSIEGLKTCNGTTVSADMNRTFFVAPRPKATVPEEIMLGCAENCASLYAALLPAAACQTAVSVQWKSGSTLHVGNPASVCPSTFPATSTVTLSNNFGCTKTYVTVVRKDTCCLNLCFTLPDTICEGSSVIPNLACMQQNMTSYRWVIEEESGSGWITRAASGYYPGPVVPANMGYLWTFQPCKRYRVRLEASRTCNGNTISANTSRIFIMAPRPIASVMEDITLSCAGGCATLNATLLPPATCETPASVQWKSGSTLYAGNPVTVCPAVFPTTYTLTLTNNFGCTKHYSTTVRKDSCCLNPCFNLPDTICEGDPLYPDLSCMQTNITMYRWVIHRMNPPAPWTPICSTAYLYGPVVPIDFSGMCTLTPGYSYGISIDVFKDCPGGNINSSIYREVYVDYKSVHFYSKTYAPGTTVNLSTITQEVSGCSGPLEYVEDLGTGIKYYPPALSFTITGSHNLVYHYGCCTLEYHILSLADAFYVPWNDINAPLPYPNGSNMDKRNTVAQNSMKEKVPDIDSWLAQNTPNPFSASTEIKYRLPEGKQDAMIVVYDMHGKQMKKFQLHQNNGAVTIEANGLNAGEYLYSLIVDGKTIDTKRMILIP